MKPVFVHAAHSWCYAGLDVDTRLLPPLQREGGQFRLAPEPTRPANMDPNSWRRLSRLARAVAAICAPILEQAASDLPVFFGTSGGEFSSTLQFLKSLHLRGPEKASPLLFQNSVHNAPASHLSILFKLTGPSETLCGGMETWGQLLLRARSHLQVQGGAVLVVVADELGPDVQTGLSYHFGLDEVFSEGAAALLLSDSSEGALAPLVEAEVPALGHCIAAPAIALVSNVLFGRS